MPRDKRCLCFRMRDGDTLDFVKTVVSFEASMRGVRPGQALWDMVMASVDVDSYPPEVQDRLSALAAAHERRSLEKLL